MARVIVMAGAILAAVPRAIDPGAMLAGSTSRAVHQIKSDKNNLHARRGGEFAHAQGREPSGNI